MAQENYEPDATVWRAVAELEKKQFTRQEIIDALEEASYDLRGN